jgi:hypothetical protein
MSKYLRVSVSKTVDTEVYIEVPDDFNHLDIKQINSLPIREAVEETINPEDWSSDLDADYDWNHVTPVEAAEAMQYTTYSFVPEQKDS